MAYTGQPQNVVLVDGSGVGVGATNPFPTADAPYTGIRVVDLSGGDFTVTQVGGAWPRGLDVGQGGSLTLDVLDPDGSTVNTVTLAGVPDGYRLPCTAIRKIYQTGTTAASLLLGW